MTRASTDEQDRIVFRKVSEAINRDAKYLALSPMPPCGRGLWHHLLFGSHITPLPGLSHVGRAAMAEELGWSPEAFDEAFAEVSGQGMAKADWKARVLWLPNALKHNLPQSPNVVRGWQRFWDRIPECELKTEAQASIKDRLKAFGEPYAKAFAEVCSKASGKTSPKPSPKTNGKGSPNASEEASPKASPNQGAERSPSEKYPSQVVTSGEGSSPPRMGARAPTHARTSPHAREARR